MSLSAKQEQHSIFGINGYRVRCVILAHMSNAPDDARYACELIADESAARNIWWCNEDDPRFLLGLTYHDRLHSDWIRFASELSNPTCDENMQLVIDVFADAVK